MYLMKLLTTLIFSLRIKIKELKVSNIHISTKKLLTPENATPNTDFSGNVTWRLFVHVTVKTSFSEAAGVGKRF